MIILVSRGALEVRLPYLDTQFLEAAMNIHPVNKMVAAHGIKKGIIREAFRGYLPDSVLGLQKAPFSDGVGDSWVDALKDHAEATVSDAELLGAAKRFPVGTPKNMEAYVYREMFDERFGSEQATATRSRRALSGG